MRTELGTFQRWAFGAAFGSAFFGFASALALASMPAAGWAGCYTSTKVIFRPSECKTTPVRLAEIPS